MTTSHTLYRFFDAEGDLLYVGRTIAPARRWREHEKGKPWFDEVASLTREQFATAEEVDSAERVAIASESPRYNIALVSPRPARKPRPKKVPESPDTLATRWAALQIETPVEHEGDHCYCDCAECHVKHLIDIEDLRAKYDWHPDIAAEIDRVEQAYFAGEYVGDWYYDVQDVELFGRMRLAGESQQRPMPAFAELEDAVATVDCPFCFRSHRHFLTSGTALDRPLPAACADAPVGDGQYILVADYLDLRNRLDQWGQQSAKRGAA